MGSLVDEILEWWEKVKYDTYDTEDDNYNVYDDEPKFVTTAKKMKKLEVKK